MISLYTRPTVINNIDILVNSYAHIYTRRPYLFAVKVCCEILSLILYWLNTKSIFKVDSVTSRVGQKSIGVRDVYPYVIVADYYNSNIFSELIACFEDCV